MNPPVDYPVKDDDLAGNSLSEMTYAALLARHEAQQSITDAMIQSASISMEAAHQLPSATKPEIIANESSAPMLRRLLEVIR